MKLNNIDIQVLIKGRPITEYFHNGDIFVEGRNGSEFELQVTNNTHARVEAVVSVDGLSVIDGKEAGERSSGYVINARDRVLIPGWKLNQESAAAFVFAGKNKSYSTEMTGSSRNNGVIGLLAYSERPSIYINQWANATPVTLGAFDSSYTYSTCGGTTLSGSNASAPGRGIMRGSADTIQCSAVRQELGTGFGQAKTFETETVSFQRGDMVAMLMAYYDNAAGLRSRGIEVGRRSKIQHTATTPQAFPGMNCMPPAGWRG